MELLERINISILPFQLKNIFTVDDTECGIQGIVDLPVKIDNTIQIMLVPPLLLFFIL